MQAKSNRQWIVQGYSTLLIEIDQQMAAFANTSVDLVVVPVGVGSLAQAVVTHYKRLGLKTTILAVEPETAACLRKSLEAGQIIPISTEYTIMAGLNCGTVSTIAWPVLQNGIDSCVAVTDFAVHSSVKELHSLNVNVGPCGAAGLAALKRLTKAERAAIGLHSDSTIVILSTEGERPYPIPPDVSINYLVSPDGIGSSNP
jgi:threonine dehydratase